jgi:hypothetical protein
MGQRALERLNSRTAARRNGKSDEQIEQIVDSAIAEVRGR